MAERSAFEDKDQVKRSESLEVTGIIICKQYGFPITEQN